MGRPSASVVRRKPIVPPARPSAADRTARRVTPVDKLSLDALAREQLRKASAAGSGRSADTVYGGHEKTLRQTVIALTAGTTLADHENPGEATVLVLGGRVRLAGVGVSWEGRNGDLIVVPQSRHSLEALTDATVLLTVAKHR